MNVSASLEPRCEKRCRVWLLLVLSNGGATGPTLRSICLRWSLRRMATGTVKSFVAELFETRRVLEVPLFEMAAVRASDEDRERVAALATRFNGSLDIGKFRRLDREFHTTIAASCDNPLLIELYGKVLDRLFRSVEFFTLLSSEANQAEVAQIIAVSSDGHKAISAAFVAGDAAAMRSAAGITPRPGRTLHDRQTHLSS